MNSTDHLSPPSRGFPTVEFENRVQQVQASMFASEMDCLIFTTEPNVRYFSGFMTQFWESPTRPWFLVIPATGKPIAVIPEIGGSGMHQTWIDDVRTWPSPRPDDEGISLLVGLIEALPKRFGRIGMTFGAESVIRMPVADLERLRQQLRHFEWKDFSKQVHCQRMVKSEREIEKIRHICQVASNGFEALPSSMQMGMTETEVVRKMKIDLLERGADTVPYIVSGSGLGGYDSIIMGPTDRVLTQGDVLMIDTGATFDGYFCDFDRNWAFGDADEATQAAYEVVWQATEAGFEAARPGATTSDLWQAMNRVMSEGGSLGNAVGRLGHGLGMQLTERPSNTRTDATVLTPGMVLTLEPGMMFRPGRQMVHEENIVITEEGAQWLSRRASRTLPVIA